MLNQYSYINTMIRVTHKKDAIINQAGRLFARFGLRRVTVEEICRATPVSKMTFYKYFPNKNALVRVIIENLYDDAGKEFQKVVEGPLSFEEKIRAIVDLKDQGSRDYSTAFIDDLLHLEDPDLRTRFEEIKQERFLAVQQFLEQSQEKGHLRADINIHFVMFMMNHILDLVQKDALNSLFKDKGEAMRELVRFFFYGVLPGAR